MSLARHKPLAKRYAALNGAGAPWDRSWCGSAKAYTRSVVDESFRRIGVFGGTFDPPHHGHFATAIEVHNALALDAVLMVVANDPWQKTAVAAIRPAADRFALVEAGIADLAAAGAKGLVASPMEIERGGPSYTADTLRSLHAQFPDADLFLLVGSDAAAGLDTWHEPDLVRDLANTVVVDRGGRQGGRPPSGWNYEVVDVPALEISSSDLRRRFEAGEPVAALTPPSVVAQVRARHLYGVGE